jgi:DNA-binding MarR family transcriptional regulator
MPLVRTRPRAGRPPADEPPAEQSEPCDACDAHVEWAVREWPEIDPDVEAIVSRVSAIDRYLDRSAVDSLETVGLAHGELKVLLRLRRERRAHGDIARELLVSTGTMTNRIDNLEEAGLVRRLPDPDDRRGVLVELTDEGRATLDRYVRVQALRERQLLDLLSTSEKRELSGMLRKLLASLESQPDLVRR